MIFVLIPYAGDPRIFTATRDEVVAMVAGGSKSESAMASLPPGIAGTEFERAWIRLTLDAKDASYFETVEDAEKYYRDSTDELDGAKRANILAALDGLR